MGPKNSHEIKLWAHEVGLHLDIAEIQERLCFPASGLELRLPCPLGESREGMRQADVVHRLSMAYEIISETIDIYYSMSLPCLRTPMSTFPVTKFAFTPVEKLKSFGEILFVINRGKAFAPQPPRQWEACILAC